MLKTKLALSYLRDHFQMTKACQKVLSNTIQSSWLVVAFRFCQFHRVIPSHPYIFTTILIKTNKSANNDLLLVHRIKWLYVLKKNKKKRIKWLCTKEEQKEKDKMVMYERRTKKKDEMVMYWRKKRKGWNGYVLNKNKKEKDKMVMYERRTKRKG